MTTGESQRLSDTYWLERNQGGFALYVDGHQRATVNTASNKAVILNGGHTPAGKLVAPHSQVIFDVVEKRLGISRVDQFRSKFGPTMIDWRGMAEKRAETHRKSFPGDTEPKSNLESALRMLNEQSTLGGLSAQAAEGRAHICQALMSFDRDGKWTEHVHRLAKQAQSVLRDVGEESAFEQAARTHCDRAVAHPPSLGGWQARREEMLAVRNARDREHPKLGYRLGR